MKELELRYVAHVVTLTDRKLKEAWRTNASSLRELINELEAQYGGFREVFVNPQTKQLNLNAMIYYNDEGEVPVTVIDLDHPIQDRGVVTFW